MANFEEHEITYANNRRIFYLAAGPVAGPLMIFMHGWPGIGKTWHNQLACFASLGFRVVAPDMPGYGRSTARKVHSDYAQEIIVQGMLAVLADTGREQAIWVGHDWGCGTLWTLANTNPQVCRAVIGICVPYCGIELGLTELLKTVNRDIYPKAQYPYGQWSYQVFYEQSFGKATGWMEKDVSGLLKALIQKSNPASLGKPARTGNVVKDDGWFGGTERPPTESATPDENSCIEHDTLQELVEAMQKTGFYPANSWYMNHTANREYNLKNLHCNRKLQIPVFFLHGRYDSVCDTITGRMAEPMRKRCSNLTETVIEAGHWVPLEKPAETNAAISRWLIEEVKDFWPGYWMSGFVKLPERAASVDSVCCPSLVDNTITSVILEEDIAGKSKCEG